MSREIEVWADWRDLGAPILVGWLRSSLSRGKEVFSFSYDPAWLDAGHSRQIDPDLRLFAGPQYLAGADRPNFGIFLDSAPDRWGRLLMQRREAAQAREAGRSARRLQETDYLLGVHDEQRTGALRFIERAKGDAWQCDEPWMRTPPWASLRELEHASWKIQDDSAMTLLGHADGTDHLAGASYLELVEFIARHGARPAADLGELWRRIVFSIAVHNTDDHLRNHGFLLAESGWILSPAFDLNPDPDGTGLSLNISETDNALSFELALEVAPFFRLAPRAATGILQQVREAVSTWRRLARSLGIPPVEQDLMASAFGI